jgi:hypothetical protein
MERWCLKNSFFILFFYFLSYADSHKKTIYPDKTKLSFEGVEIEGELKNPGEFYFQHRTEEKMDSLIKRRKHFHKEMLRDVMMSK